MISVTCGLTAQTGSVPEPYACMAYETYSTAPPNHMWIRQVVIEIRVQTDVTRYMWIVLRIVDGSIRRRNYCSAKRWYKKNDISGHRKSLSARLLLNINSRFVALLRGFYWFQLNYNQFCFHFCDNNVKTANNKYILLKKCANNAKRKNFSRAWITISPHLWREKVTTKRVSFGRMIFTARRRYA